MATINFDKWDGEDIYNEGDAESKLLKFYRGGGSGIMDYEGTFFYTTPIRANIVNWYPFEKGSSILEIGGGCGPITGALLKNAGRVVSVESSKRRAQVLYERHKDSDNLEILCGNFDNLKLQEKFDYIVLVGVFEYAGMFFKSENPFKEFLDKMLAVLKPGGVILIAIENKLGIKYLAGLSEDHFSRPFVGVEGYVDKKLGPQRTFGRQEWAEMLEAAGLKYQFYGVFPDYKLPSFIFREDAVVSNGQVNGLYNWNMCNDAYSFDTGKALRSFNNNGLLLEVANSFLIEIGRKERNFSRCEFVNFPNYRGVRNYVATMMEANAVKKVPLTDAAVLHLKRLAKTHRTLNEASIKSCTVTEREGEFICEKIEGRSLGEIAEEYVRQGDANKAAALIIAFIKMLREHTKLVKVDDLFDECLRVFGEKIRVLPVNSLDMQLHNAMMTPRGEVVLIDQEWTTDRQLPFEYCVFSTVDVFYIACPAMEKFYKKSYFYEKFGIDEKKLRALVAVRDKYYEENELFSSPQAKWVHERSLGKKLVDEDSGKEVCVGTMAGEVEYWRDKAQVFRSAYQEMVRKYDTRFYRTSGKIYDGLNKILPEGSKRRKAVSDVLTAPARAMKRKKR